MPPPSVKNMHRKYALYTFTDAGTERRAPRGRGARRPARRAHSAKRVTLSKLGQDFIDEYVHTYAVLSGDPMGRKRLYKEIFDQSQTRTESLDSGNWTPHTIAKRLQNKMHKMNKAQAAEHE